MRTITVNQEFSFGTPDVKVTLSGRYADLDEQATDAVRAAIMASYLHLPTLLNTDSQRNRSSQQQNVDAEGANTPATSRLENPNGSIEIQLNIKNARKGIPQDILQTVADAIGSSVLNHGNAALAQRPATNDAFVQLTRYMTGARQPSREFAGTSQSDR